MFRNLLRNFGFPLVSSQRFNQGKRYTYFRDGKIVLRHDLKFKTPTGRPRGSTRLVPPVAVPVAEPVVNPLQRCDDDKPLTDVRNPYAKPRRQCLLCKYNVQLDYKNARLLSQFLSSFTGRLYDRHITGVCEYQHKLLLRAIKQSRRAGYMPILGKHHLWLRDPKIFNSAKPNRPNPF